ncbi:MAG: hypothetical protein R3D98_06885 [Candidatus Krumholzibacteriia bacterium]
MFRPTQTAPTTLTGLTVVLGFSLTILLVVVALVSTVDLGVESAIRTRASQNSGLLFLTAVLIFSAAIRPLLGGLLLLAMGIAIYPWLPITSVIAVVFSALSLTRAYLSRRYLARQK